MEKLIIVAAGVGLFWFCLGLIEGVLGRIFIGGVHLKGCLGCLSLLAVGIAFVGVFALVFGSSGPSADELTGMSDMDVRMHVTAEMMKVSQGEISTEQFSESPYLAEFHRRDLANK